jgi:hypothetical protein
MELYVKWSSSFTLNKIQMWLANPSLYGMPSPLFYDRDSNTLTPTASPSDVDDYIAVDGVYRKYE